jgi:hypothetical protein
MTKIHHTHDRSVEHAKARDFMAHRLVTPDAPESGFRSTRGHAVGDVQNGTTVRPLPAVDIQPRHGGKAKGGIVAHSWGNTEQQISKENTAHVVTEAVDASSANPLDLMTSSQAGKRLPVPACHTGTPSKPERGIYDPDNAHHVLSEGIAESGSDHPAALPATVEEK